MRDYFTLRQIKLQLGRQKFSKEEPLTGEPHTEKPPGQEGWIQRSCKNETRSKGNWWIKSRGSIEAKAVEGGLSEKRRTSGNKAKEKKRKEPEDQPKKKIETPKKSSLTQKQITTPPKETPKKKTTLPPPGKERKGGERKREKRKTRGSKEKGILETRKRI